MIICRTPFRLSFFGGGTDYPSWYLKQGGAVLSTTIDKYCYITLRYLPPFFEHRIRIVYSKVELCQSYEEIKHPAVRETLRFLDVDRGLEIHHDGDLPARSGMGSSSAFTVGLLHSLYALQGRMTDCKQLSRESIHIEQNMIRETVGSQDQVAAAHGGINHILFHKNGEIEVKSLILKKSRRQELYSHLMLFYTGIIRTASDVAKSYVEDLGRKKELLTEMHSMVDEAISILQGDGSLDSFGHLLHRTWMAKRSLSAQVSNTIVDDIYQRARDNGAIGGKISGAGGGGMLLLFVPPSHQARVREELGELLHIPFSFEPNGSQIILYDPQIDDYSKIEQDRSERKLKSFCELDDLKK